MARPYTVTLTDGTGTANVLSGNYTVTANVNGYENTTIDPSTLTVDKTTGTYSFTIDATGTLNLHVTEEGTSDGVAIQNATFIRCDSEGNEYGSEITSNITGLASFANVPFAEDSTITVYYKQKSSDGEHEFDDTLKNITTTIENTTVEVQNALPLQRTINVTDANYANLSVSSGTLTLS